MLSDDALHDAILANPSAKAAADRGDDAGAALAVAATLPPEVVPTYLQERAVIGLFTDPADGEAVLEAFEAAANSTSPQAPLFKRVLGWLKEVGSLSGGVDFGSPMVRGIVDQLQAAGVFTATQAATLKAAAERPATIDPAAVSRAWARHRPGGKVQ